VIAVVLAVLVAGAAGIVAGRRWTASERIARAVLGAMLYVLFPVVTFANVAHLRLTTQIGVGLGLAYATLVLTGLAGWFVGARVLRLERPQTGALICAGLLANTGYLGLPLTVALLGSSQLPVAVLYDQLVSGPTLLIAGFGVGAAFGTRAGVGAAQRVRAFAARNPPLAALIAGLIAGPAFAPPWLLDASHAIVLALLPLGFLAVGVNLAAHGRPPTGHGRALGAAVGLRVVFAPLALLALSRALVGAPDAYRLQSAMPTAVNSLVVAHAYGLDLPLAAAAIGWSTVVVLAGALAASLLL
jgi:predicted permease